MKVISANISEPKTVIWKNKEVTTGIFKEPINDSITLGKTDVQGDHVIDRRYHGGEDKACYLYSSDHYPFWKEQYPDLDWTYGMFGENLTVEGLEETEISIGDTYKVGTATVQVAQPRQPCFKLGLKFEDQGILKKFIAQSYSGIYLRILTSGSVQKGDEFELIEKNQNGLSVAGVFHLLYHSTQDQHLQDKVREDQYLPVSLKEYIVQKFKG